MEKQKLIDSFNKNSVEVVKVQLHEWKSQKYVDIRAWYIEDSAKNIAEKPSHKGLTLNIDLLPNLIQALQKAQEELEKEK